MQKGSPEDPKGLIFEAYRIDGITLAECRTIFLDWALSLPDGFEQIPSIRVLLDQYGAGTQDHPMTQVLSEGLLSMATPKRRGGWRGRPRD